MLKNRGVSEKIMGFCEKSNCIKDSVYIDDGVSGVTFDRPNFNRMIAEIEAGNVATVIVKDDCVIIELNLESP